MNISNKLLAVLLVIAIVLSVGGAMITITQVTNLVNIIPALSGITGLGTTGRVNVTVSAVAQLSVAPSNIEFGNGYVSTGTIAELNSSAAIPTNWTAQGGWSAKDLGIVNTGTVDIFVNASSSATGATMIGGTGPYIQFDASNNQSSSCGRALANLTTIAAASTEYEVCKNVSFVSTTQSINVSVVLGVPQDAAVGNKTALLTFTATRQSGP